MSLAMVGSLLDISVAYIYKLLNDNLYKKAIRTYTNRISTRRHNRVYMKDKDRRQKVTPNMLNYIIDPKTVQKWAGYTLSERAVLLHRVHPETHIQGNRIGEIYRQHKIKRKVVVIKKFSNLKTERKIKV